MIIIEGDKKLVETLQQMAERLKVSTEDAKAERSIIGYYQKNQFEGLADFCEFIEVGYLFAEKTITNYLDEPKKT